MYYLKTSASFDSAHFLSGHSGKCANIHGHCWRVEVKVQGGELCPEGEKRGMLIDFRDLKNEVRSIADSLDHTLIYEKDSLRPATLTALREEGFSLTEVPFRPTAENLARYFFDALSGRGFEISSVTVYETEENCAVYEVEK